MKRAFYLSLTYLLFVLLLYFFRRVSFFIGKIINDNNLVFFIYDETTTRALIQLFVDLSYVFLIFLIFRSYNKLKKYITVFILFPLLTDVSDILYDKTCWKPWINFYSFIWYLPLRLVIWIIIILILRYEIKNLLSFKKILFLLIVVIGYTILKPF